MSPIVPEQDRHELSILELDSFPPEVHLVETGAPVDVSPDGADGKGHVDRLARVQEWDNWGDTEMLDIIEDMIEQLSLILTWS